MTIKLLGSGYDDYKNLEENARMAIEELGIEARIEKVEDFTTIYGYGVFKTIGLVIDGKIKSMGRVSTVEEIKNYMLEGGKSNG